MTGEEICVLAELNTEELDIDRDNGLIWINQCLLDNLPKDGKVIGTETVVTAANTLTAVTSSFLSIFEIRESSSDVPYYGKQYGNTYGGLFDFRPGFIRMPHAGTFTITGYVIPTPMDDLDDECPVHQLFHPAIALWVASQAIRDDDETNENGLIRRQEFFDARNRALVDLDEIMPTKPAFVRSRAWN